MVKVWVNDVPPPGAAFNTVTDAVPPAAISEAGTAAVIEVALTNVVTSATPFHSTTEALTKLDPVSVNVKPAPPAVAEVGAMEVSAGAGLLIASV